MNNSSKLNEHKHIILVHSIMLIVASHTSWLFTNNFDTTENCIMNHQIKLKGIYYISYLLIKLS